MQVCRDARGGEALIALTVDSAVPAEVVDEITRAIGATAARGADLPGELRPGAGQDPAVRH
jgi:D-3-phosphoglycerate dehydrogenase